LEVIGFSYDYIKAYISLKLVKGEDPANWLWPTTTTYNYSITNSYFGDFSLSLPFNDINTTCNNDDYTYRCAVLITLININADESYYLHPLTELVIT